MARMLRAFWLCSVLVLAAARPASAAVCTPGTTHTFIQLAPIGAPPGGCQWALGVGPQFVLVEIRAYTTPISKVAFSLQDPPFGTVDFVGWNFPSTGDRINGIELSLGCSGGLVSLGILGLTLDPGETVPCTSWTAGVNCTAWDCNGNVVPAAPSPQYFISAADPLDCSTCFQYCEFLPPHNLSPVDDATQVPVDVELQWGGPVFDYVDDNLGCWIFIGTSPNCEDAQLIAVPCDTRSIVLDFLEPSTTYYWRASWLILAGSGCSNASGGTSNVHSFTTQPPIKAQAATWGRVKAMYRE